jgi:glyceraldehyde 3-phosphate dehydrogenase
MALKVAITGFGRIGRCVARILDERDDIDLVVVNDTADREMTRYLLQYDSVHGEFGKKVEILEDDYMQIGDSKVKFLSDRDPNNLDFAAYGAEVLLECTGVFYTQEKAQVYLDKGIKKVLFSAPAKDKETATFVMGVNEDKYAGEKIVSNASCTTNCLGPVVKVLDDAFGIEKGLLTTCHSYTNDQNILDVKHSKDPRRARAAAVNMIPTSTGAAKAIALVMPHLKGKLNGQAIRVPTPNVSMIDINVIVKKDTTIEEVNAAFAKAEEGYMKGFIAVDYDKRVSSDFIGCETSAIVAEDLTQVMDGNMVKVMAWYDNEWGYSCRLIDMAAHISREG